MTFSLRFLPWAAVSALALTACIDPPASAPAPSRTAAGASAPVPAPAPPAALPGALTGPAAEAVTEAAVVAQVRAWLAQGGGAEWFRDAEVRRVPAHDTAQVRCVEVVPTAAPEPQRARRLVCVAGTEVLAGDAGLQRYLQLHQFDPRPAEGAARVLLSLRDAMLGFGGREFTTVRAQAEGDALVIEAEGTLRTAPSQPPRPGRWRITLDRDGTTREEPLS
jgi:hypothetical protein